MLWICQFKFAWVAFTSKLHLVSVQMIHLQLWMIHRDNSEKQWGRTCNNVKMVLYMHSCRICRKMMVFLVVEGLPYLDEQGGGCRLEYLLMFVLMQLFQIMTHDEYQNVICAAASSLISCYRLQSQSITTLKCCRWHQLFPTAVHICRYCNLLDVMSASKLSMSNIWQIHQTEI